LERTKYLDIDFSINELLLEVEEVKAEIKPNNIPYLEDELGDILWDWLLLVSNLKRLGLVTNHQNIINRAIKKYKERVLPFKGDMSDSIIWKEVKKRQKEELKRELDAK
jgi:NTP pyrophosphatase (non-canonical NTP hydrolase)